MSACGPIGKKPFRVGLRDGAPPLAHAGDKKTPSGFEADYARMLAEKLGRAAKLKFVAPEDMAQELESGAIDCVVSARESVHDYISGFQETDPFIAYGVCVVVAPDDDTLTRESDLRGRRVGVLANSDADALCESLFLSIAFDLRKYDVESQPFQDLRLKKNNVVFADELYARYMAMQQPEHYRVMDHVYGRKQYGLRLSRKISKDFELEISAAIAELARDPALRGLYEEWFGRDLR
jgi:polar amino acid transport system substrate-binding protein